MTKNGLWLSLFLYMSLDSVYRASEYETTINSAWQDAGVGEVVTQLVDSPELESTHSILMPPPNLTGVLHAGHSFQHYLMDTLSRIHRQQGDLNLWQPGVDHAGIQLEGVIDKLFKQGEIELPSKVRAHEAYPADVDELPKFLKTHFRDFWLETAWSKVNEWRETQREQATILGDTPDYTKSLFTLDSQAVEMVNHAFLRYWEDGLIYKKSYMINWSVGLQTALSDVPEDIGHETRKDPFVTIKYQLARNHIEGKDPYPGVHPELLINTNYADIKNLYLEVTTVRPETVFSDQFLLVNLNSQSITGKVRELLLEYKKAGLLEELYAAVPLGATVPSNAQYVSNGQLFLPLVFTEDPEEVDPNFGTGVLKVTPAHDPHDYELYEKYKKNAIYYISGPTQYKSTGRRKGFESSVEKSGKLSLETGAYHGLKIQEGRKKIIYDLIKRNEVPQSREYDEKIEKYAQEYLKGFDLKDIQLSTYKIDWKYEHNVTICERSKTVVEPLISEEFFLNYRKSTSRNGKTLIELAEEGIKETTYFPNNFQEMAANFVKEDNLRDWCISRNLVWGHSMPIWYNLELNPNRTFIDRENYINDTPLRQLARTEGYNFNFSDDPKNPRSAATASDAMKLQIGKPSEPGDWVQEEKILDTWFSSCLWPLSTLKYIEATRDLDWEAIPQAIDASAGAREEHDFFKFYSTNEMITAREIFYAWVVRMTMLGKYFTGRVPFESVVITPTIQDEKGRKMSKSLGNGLDPAEAIEKYSSDSLRLAMLSGMYPNRNMKMGGKLADTMLEKYRNFGNKLWNVGRFLQQIEEE